MLASVLPLLAVGAAPAEVALKYGSVAETAEQLRPGEFLWMPQVAPLGPVLMVVSLSTQRVIVYRNGIPIAVSTVSTGKAGKRTPAGVFTILQKRQFHRSNIYSNAPMPFMQRLTWTGIALHAGNLPGYPASHGCIRLPMAFARQLFDVTELGMTVVVTRGHEMQGRPVMPPMIDPPIGDDDVLPRDNWQWQPDRAREGPVSILVSGADRSVTVLRNGVEIGRASVRFNGAIDRTTAYSLQYADAHGQRWMRLPLPGEQGALGNSEWRRFRIPAGFKRAMLSVASPGTTVIVTNDTLRASGTGQTATILEADPAG